MNVSFSEKAQIIFVGNIPLPAFLGTQVAANIIETKPIGMVIGTILIFIYYKILIKNEDDAKAVYYGGVFLFFTQVFPIVHIVVGLCGTFASTLLDPMKIRDERHISLTWDIVGNIQLLMITIFTGFIMIMIAIWVGYRLGGVKRN